jgi:hypothetical protein
MLSYLTLPYLGWHRINFLQLWFVFEVIRGTGGEQAHSAFLPAFASFIPHRLCLPNRSSQGIHQHHNDKKKNRPLGGHYCAIVPVSSVTPR